MKQIDPELEKLIQQSRNLNDAVLRRGAIYALRKGWSGDSEAKAAILRAPIGVPEAGVPPDEDVNARINAIDALREGWSGDSEVRAAFLRAVEHSTEKRGENHDETKILRGFLSHLSPDDSKGASGEGARAALAHSSPRVPSRLCDSREATLFLSCGFAGGADAAKGLAGYFLCCAGYFHRRACGRFQG